MSGTLDGIEWDVRGLEGQPMLPLAAVLAERVIRHCRELADRVAFLEAERRATQNAGEVARAEG